MFIICFTIENYSSAVNNGYQQEQTYSHIVFVEKLNYYYL